MRHEQEKDVTIEFVKDHPWGVRGAVKVVKEGYAKMMTQSGYTKIVEDAKPDDSTKKAGKGIRNKSLSASA
jgi:hypothetical protein